MQLYDVPESVQTIFTDAQASIAIPSMVYHFSMLKSLPSFLVFIQNNRLLNTNSDIILETGGFQLKPAFRDSSGLYPGIIQS